MMGRSNCWVRMVSSRAAEIAAPLNFGAVLLQILHRIVVAHARERRLDGFELRDVAFEHLQFLAALVEDAADDVNHHLLGHALDLFEIRVRHLRLDHPELREMPARFRFLGAERWPEAVDLAERHGRRFAVKLARLRQVGLVVVEVIDFEERGGSFAGGGSEDGRVDEREAVVIEVIAHRL